MIFLILHSGEDTRIWRFTDEQRDVAAALRLAMDLRRQYVITLEGASEAIVRRTHGRYFEAEDNLRREREDREEGR